MPHPPIVPRSDRQEYIDAVPLVPADQILDYPEVAKLMRVSRKTVERLAIAKKLPSYKLGDAKRGPVRRVFRRDEVMAFIASRRAS